MISGLLVYKFTVGVDRRISCQIKVCNKDINILNFSCMLQTYWPKSFGYY